MLLIFAQALPDPTSLTFWLQNFGPVGVILFFGGVGLWRVWTFAKPHIAAIALGHVKFMDTTSEIQKVISADLAHVKQTQLEHGEKIDEIHRHVVRG